MKRPSIGLRSLLVLAVLVGAAAGSTGAYAAPDDGDDAETAYAEAMAAMKRGDLGEGARAFDRAYAHNKSVALVWNAARAYHQNDELALALARYETCTRHTDFPASKQAALDGYRVEVAATLEARAAEVEAAEAAAAAAAAAGAESAAVADPAPAPTPVAELAPAPPPAPEPPAAPWGVEAARPAPSQRPAANDPSTAHRALSDDGVSDTTLAGWVLAGTGLAIAGAGLGMHFAAEGRRDDVRTALAGAGGGAVLTMSQRQAYEHQTDADTLDTIGMASVGVGSAAAVLGVILLIAESGDDAPPSSGVTVGGHVGPGAASVSAGFAF